MIGIGLTFSDAGAGFDFRTPVIDFSSTVQNAMVNLSTRLGSDPIYPDRGTRLFQDATSGKMVNLAWANHSANFAALRTLAFIQNTDDANNKNRLTGLRLLATRMKAQGVVLTLGAQSNLGESIGSVAVI